MKNINYIPVEDYHLDRVIELLLLCFPTLKVNSEEFKHVNFRSPISNYKPLGFVAMDEEKVVGFRGFIPLLYSFNGSVKKVLAMSNTATHPEYRRKGIFIGLFEMSLKFFYKEYPYILNTSSSKNTVPAYSKYNTLILGEKDYLYKKSFKKKQPMSFKNNKISFSKIVPTTVIKSVYNASVFSKDMPIRIDLNSEEFIEWLFKSKKYEWVILYKDDLPIAYCCFLIEGNKCNLIHFDVNNRDNSLKLLLNAISTKYDIDLFVFFSKKNNSLRKKMLNKCGFLGTNFSLVRKILKKEIYPILMRPTLIDFKEEDLNLQGLDISNMNNWDITSLSYY